MKNIHYQVFLRPGEFKYLEDDQQQPLNAFVFTSQKWVTGVLKRYITSPKECGMAEALLIGYRNDLDRDLVQSYSNTGVVHVVAISGLHLGLIYALLNFICRAFDRYQMKRIISPVIILIGLWLFTLLAGASPSILRSAVLFSFIVIGQAGSRQSLLLNNLAASAFFLLCYEPYWLRDLGFILSYAALLSITIFMDPIHDKFVPVNRLIGLIWKVSAVTIAAQVLTMPVLIYYFGQFPNLFLLTNFVAIPLSSIILCGLISLCVANILPPLAEIVGQVVRLLITWMNSFVGYIDGMSFSSTKDINITFLQLIILYLVIGFIANWLIAKHKASVYAALISLILFFIVVLQPLKGTS
jgi:competence protein ComEC